MAMDDFFYSHEERKPMSKDFAEELKKALQVFDPKYKYNG